jgi:hypothetical protein
MDVARHSSVVGIGVGLHPGYNVAQQLYVGRGYVPDGRGVSYRDRYILEGEHVVLDDELLLHFTKLSFVKWFDQDADCMVSSGKAIRQLRYTRVAVRSCVVEEPGHTAKTTCTRTGRSPARLGVTAKAGPRRP